MKKDFKLLAVCFLSVLLVTGCATLTNEVLHDEIFTYEESYDTAYLKILEAGASIPGWVLESTSKAEGLVMFRQSGAVGERAVLIVRMVDKNLVSIELAKSSQSIRGVGDLLHAIDSAFLESARRQQAMKP